MNDFMERRAARLLAQAEYFAEGSAEQERTRALGRTLLLLHAVSAAKPMGSEISSREFGEVLRGLCALATGD
jgi:hypothetical protein